MFEEKQEKMRLVALVHENRGTVPAISLLKLIEILVQDYRVANDVAPPDEVRLNQGSIQALKQLASYIVIGVPGKRPADD